MERYKIRVNNPAESTEAQELFFELGYAWSYSGKAVRYVDLPILTTFSNGFMDAIYCADTFEKIEKKRNHTPAAS